MPAAHRARMTSATEITSSPSSRRAGAWWAGVSDPLRCVGDKAHAASHRRFSSSQVRGASQKVLRWVNTGVLA